VGALGLKKRLRPDGRAKDSVVVLIEKGSGVQFVFVGHGKRCLVWLSQGAAFGFCWAGERRFG